LVIEREGPEPVEPELSDPVVVLLGLNVDRVVMPDDIVVVWLPTEPKLKVQLKSQLFR